jgi:ThiF family protein
MDPWFFREPERLRRERQELAGLQERSTWLIGHEWRLTDSGLCVDAVVRAHGHDYEVRVTFPSLFPDAPAVVHPLNAQRRLSQHQYGGKDGPLCLQWGPDNWHRDVTAANLVESAYELFDTENALGRTSEELPIVAPSRHHLTIGQETRREWARWWVSPAFEEYLRPRHQSVSGSLKFSFRRSTNKRWVALVHEASEPDGEVWADPFVPNDLPEAGKDDWYAGAWFSVTAASSEVSQLESVTALSALLPSGAPPNLLAMDGSSPIEGMQRSLAGAVVRDGDARLHLLVFFANGELFECASVESVDFGALKRAPESPLLATKTIGIVGVGSAGSKIALALARMGARKFYLVDHDIMLPENIERNALDWQSVGLHKADAVAKALRWISPAVEVEVSHLHLTGQESNAAVSAAMARLSKSDIIIDATADPRAFNVLASAARAASRAFVWFEVFGGGLGGLIGRSRPDADANAQDMRLAYLQYCQEHPAPPDLRTAIRYEVSAGDGHPIAASDVDVALISHHAARLAVDSLHQASESKYPFSMYLLGLARGWVFQDPFDTIPIVTPRAASDDTSGEQNEQLHRDNLAFLSDLLAKKT